MIQLPQPWCFSQNSNKGDDLDNILGDADIIKDKSLLQFPDLPYGHWRKLALLDLKLIDGVKNIIWVRKWFGGHESLRYNILF